GSRTEKLPELNDPGVTANGKREVVRAFLAANPDVQLEPFVMPQVGNALVQDTGPLMAIAAGVAPQVMFVNFRKSSTYISQGFLEPMEVLLARLLSANPRVRQADAHEN